ncbi:hypothetical protein B0H14DRAFT_2890211 [Mycena olivaceomarginata]|nr:hypothetical protein B0H14DRAFT_2890211 [Mycena olivaceomarginata]
MPTIAYTTGVGSFFYLVNVAEAVFARFVNAGLLGSLCRVSNIIPEAIQSAFVTIGYIGLLLIVFEAGLRTQFHLSWNNTCNAKACLSTASSLSSNIIVPPHPRLARVRFGVPIVAFISRSILKRIPCAPKSRLFLPNAQLFIMAVALSWVSPFPIPSPPRHPNVAAPVLAFDKHIMPMLQVFFSPLFFASIGSALPVRSLGSVDGSSRVIWRGLVYSLFMGLAKLFVGLWLLVWPDRVSGHGWFGRRLFPSHTPREGEEIDLDESPLVPDETELTRTRSAALVGIAMMARGEIALIVAEMSRPLLGIHEPGQASEPFAIVIWATLLNTAGGAVFLGLLLRRQKLIGEGRRRESEVAVAT